MKTNTPVSPSGRGYFLSHVYGCVQGSTGMRLLALAFDLVLIVLLLTLSVLFVFGQTWLLHHAVYADAAFYLLAVSVPTLYFVGFHGVLGATPGKLLLLPWL